MFKRFIRVDNDYSRNKIATNVVNENSVMVELKKNRINHVEFVCCYSAKEYFSNQKLLNEIKSKMIICQNNLYRSNLDSVFEYNVNINGKLNKLVVISPSEFFHSSYINWVYEI